MFFKEKKKLPTCWGYKWKAPKGGQKLFLSGVRGIPGRREVNMGLIGEGKISLGTDWWEVLNFRNFPAAG